MRPAEIQVKINVLNHELNFWKSLLAKKSCRDCEHGQTQGWCQKFEAQPPEDVQKAGCDEWSWDQIPF